MGLNFYRTALLVIPFAVPVSRIFYISKKWKVWNIATMCGRNAISAPSVFSIVEAANGSIGDTGT
jgi:hypothetical protein